MSKNKAAEQEVITEVKNLTFSKRDLLQSNRYAKDRDILAVVLDDVEEYTTEAVDALIKSFLERKVK